MHLPEGTPVVLIIGGGYSGVALTIRLLERWQQPLHIIIAEPRHSLGRGEAYSTTDIAQLMNGPAGNFSIHPHDLSHLARWVERTSRETGVGVSSKGADDLFIPRSIFGQYVGEELEHSIRSRRFDVHVEHARSQVVEVHRHRARGVTASFANGRRLSADIVVLATGVFPLSADPALAPVAGDWRLAKPGETEKLERLADAKDILIIGASLSMVDAVASLEARGYRGKYHVISRRGYLIQQVRRAEEPLPILDPTALPRTARELLSTVIKARKQLLAQGIDWQVLPLSLRPFILPMWQRASTTERLRFARHLRALWDVTAHRAAPASYAAIEAARIDGRFAAKAARLVSIADNGENLGVRLRRRGQRDTEGLEVDAIIDARGHQEHDWNRIRDPLVQQLLDSGMVRRHDTGFGIDATADSGVVDRHGIVHSDLFALGHPLRGVAWESSSLTELRGQAAELSARICQSLQFGSPTIADNNPINLRQP